VLLDGDRDLEQHVPQVQELRAARLLGVPAVDPTTGDLLPCLQSAEWRGWWGVGIAASYDLRLTWSFFSIPGTGSTDSACDTEWNFDPVKVDGQGNVYVAWGELRDSSVQIPLAVSRDHG